MESIRACQNTQTLWLGIPTDEKGRFLRHLFRYWEIIRSRLLPESEAIISTMRDSGQFNVIAGQIHDFVETGEALEVHYIPQGQTTDEERSNFTRAIDLRCDQSTRMIPRAAEPVAALIASI